MMESLVENLEICKIEENVPESSEIENENESFNRENVVQSFEVETRENKIEIVHSDQVINVEKAEDNNHIEGKVTSSTDGEDDEEYEECSSVSGSENSETHKSNDEIINKEETGCAVEDSSKKDKAREAGDGQESSKIIDHDEDKKNPQYIPKKGKFYEHDDRMAEEATVVEEKKEDIKTKKKPVSTDVDRWHHDKFNEFDQTPKSRDELVDIYGYDIRNEDGPPKARRRRRYGRGPTKYTRNWEDQKAYNKRKPTEYNQERLNYKKEFPNVDEIQTVNFKTKKSDRYNSQDSKAEGSKTVEIVVEKPVEKDSRIIKHQIVVEEMRVMPSAKNEPTPFTRGSRRFNRGGKLAGLRTVEFSRSDLKSKEENALSTSKLSNSDKADIAALSEKFSNAVINIGTNDQEITPIRGSSAPPTDKPSEKSIEVMNNQNEIKLDTKKPSSSKRYSVQRQKFLHTSATYQPSPTQNQQFLNQVPAQQYYQQQHSESDSAIYGGYSTASSTQVYESQQPSGPPQTQLQPTVIYPTGPPPQLISHHHHVPPPQFHQPPPTASMIMGYPAPPPQTTPTFTAPVQPTYAPPIHNTAIPPPELYTGQGGITYYSPQSQPAPRHVPSRRVKVAIPIIPPPEHCQNQQQAAE